MQKIMTAVLVGIMAFATSIALADETDIDVKNGGLKVEQAGNEFEVNAAVMWDFDRYEGVHRHLEEEDNEWIHQSELRRARIEIKGDIKDDWQAKLQFDFDDESSSVDIDDAIITYSGCKHADLTIGQTKEPFGLETLTSSKYTTFIERAMVSNAISPGRQPGIGLSGDIKKRLTWALGVYEVSVPDQETANSEREGDIYAVTGRLTYAPWLQDHSVIHIGISGSTRNLDGEIYRIDENAEVHTAREIVDSAEIPTDTLNLLGLEFACNAGPVSLQAEYMKVNVDAAIGDDADFDGYYAQLSYFITGESRRYKKGVFGKIKPFRKCGALELTTRYSALDARDHDVGNEAANTVLGATYYFNPQVRLMGNYIMTEVESDDGEETGDAFSLRVQFLF